MSTIRIHALFPTATDGTSFYRGAGPLCALRKQLRDTVDIQINQPTRVDWSTQVDCDIMFMQRPCLGKHVQVAQITKECRVPLVVDYDDDLMNVTTDNPTAATYGNEQIQTNIKSVLEMADAVIVSTPSIAESLSPFSKKIVIIPNAWDEQLRPFIDPLVSRFNRCIWRGSATHIRDMLEVAHGVTTAAELFSNWNFVFMGWEPWFVTERKTDGAFEAYPKQEVLPYLDTLRGLAGKILYVPLADTKFNRGKSNIAWLEASYAGCAVLAPNFPEWDKPGIEHYVAPEMFGAALERMLKFPWEELKPKADASRAYIRENLLLSKINAKRMEIFDGLLAGSGR